MPLQLVIIIVATFIGFVAWDGRAEAADKSWSPPGLGIGDEDCSAWLARSEPGKSSREKQESWLFGFLSGYNYFADPKVGLFFHYDEPELPYWIDRECQRNLHQKLTVTIDLMLRKMLSAKGTFGSR
jgi:hypothetical protein